MHFLHMTFQCDGQPFPAVEGRPGFPLYPCRCGRRTEVCDLLPAVPPPAAEDKIECVLEAARVLSIWWGSGSISMKCQRIMNKAFLSINPKAVAVAYSFFKMMCTHVAIMSGLVPLDARLNHKRIPGWPWDITRIVEYGWNMGRSMEWMVEAQSLAEENQHARTIVLVPEVLHRLTFCGKGSKTTLFHHRSFREIRRNNNVPFADEVGSAVIVLPPKEPEDAY
ncbi:unnamed protein product [Nippostrongylus brasiliensis]|uniref:Abhydrolase_3 domain-containing protein n=1 Tax=Nippostrongylus brasiliensis TaxID=27835 RepID=A0A0N4XNU2_NIPBR|nr:unnamed protein product [Nippostrongylus brasiliensis]